MDKFGENRGNILYLDKIKKVDGYESKKIIHYLKQDTFLQLWISLSI